MGPRAHTTTVCEQHTIHYIHARSSRGLLKTRPKSRTICRLIRATRPIDAIPSPLLVSILRRRRCARRSSISACRRCARRTSRPTSCTRWSRSIRCMRTSATTASWCSCRNSSRRTRSSASTRTSRRIRRAGSNTRAATPNMAIARFGLGAHSKVMEIASNDGYLLQHFVARGIPVLGIEPAANVAKVGDREGHPDDRAFLRPRHGREASRANTASPTCCSATTCWRTCRTSTISSAGMKLLLAPRRRDHDGVPAPAAADGREPVRHHLSRALQLLLVRRGREDLRAPRPDASSTSRNCRRTADRCASTRATPRMQRCRSRSASARCASAKSTTAS